MILSLSRKLQCSRNWERRRQIGGNASECGVVPKTAHTPVVGRVLIQVRAFKLGPSGAMSALHPSQTFADLESGGAGEWLAMRRSNTSSWRCSSSISAAVGRWLSFIRLSWILK